MASYNFPTGANVSSTVEVLNIKQELESLVEDAERAALEADKLRLYTKTFDADVTATYTADLDKYDVLVFTESSILPSSSSYVRSIQIVGPSSLANTYAKHSVIILQTKADSKVGDKFVSKGKVAFQIESATPSSFDISPKANVSQVFDVESKGTQSVITLRPTFTSESMNSEWINSDAYVPTTKALKNILAGVVSTYDEEGKAVLSGTKIPVDAEAETTQMISAALDDRALSKDVANRHRRWQLTPATDTNKKYDGIDVKLNSPSKPTNSIYAKIVICVNNTNQASLALVESVSVLDVLLVPVASEKGYRPFIISANGDITNLMCVPKTGQTFGLNPLDLYVKWGTSVKDKIVTEVSVEAYEVSDYTAEPSTTTITLSNIVDSVKLLTTVSDQATLEEKYEVKLPEDWPTSTEIEFATHPDYVKWADITNGGTSNSWGDFVSLGKKLDKEAAPAPGSIVIDTSASEDIVGNVSIGHGASIKDIVEKDTTALATKSVAIGYNASVKGTVDEKDGTTTVVHVEGSVAIGSGSEATEPNVVSVGAEKVKRRIINVAEPKEDNDAVTLSYFNLHKQVDDTHATPSDDDDSTSINFVTNDIVTVSLSEWSGALSDVDPSNEIRIGHALSKPRIKSLILKPNKHNFKWSGQFHFPMSIGSTKPVSRSVDSIYVEAIVSIDNMGIQAYVTNYVEYDGESNDNE
jgi:hypothetical protein